MVTVQIDLAYIGFPNGVVSPSQRQEKDFEFFAFLLGIEPK